MSTLSGFGDPRTTELGAAVALGEGALARVAGQPFDAPDVAWEKHHGTWRPVVFAHVNLSLPGAPPRGYITGSVVQTTGGFYRRLSDGSWASVTVNALDEQPAPTIAGAEVAGDLYVDRRTDAALYQYDDGAWVAVGSGGGGGLPQEGNGTFIETGTGAAAWGNAADAGSTISADGDGAFAFGTVVGDGTVTAPAGSAVAFGKVSNNGSEGNTLLITSGGGLAFGYVVAEGDNNTLTIQCNSDTGIAFGHVYATGDGSTVLVNAEVGAVAFGSVNTSVASVLTISADAGGQAFGYMLDNGYAAALSVLAGKGGLAFGYVSGYDDAQDFAITAAAAALAFGYAYGYNITASGQGSVAFGVADSADIIASANGAMQIGAGTNNVAGSLRVGEGIWLLPSIPGAPSNGQIWVDGSGNVVIRSGGASVVIA